MTGLGKLKAFFLMFPKFHLKGVKYPVTFILIDGVLSEKEYEIKRILSLVKLLLSSLQDQSLKV